VNQGGIAAADYIAVWNGTGWASVGGGITGVGVFGMGVEAGGLLHVGGVFTTVNGITPPDSHVIWNGSTFLFSDIDLPGPASLEALAFGNDGTLTLGIDQTIGTTATAAAITTATNSTPGYVYPRLVINGPSSGTSRIYQIVNYTTGFGVWLNLTLSPGEVATLNFDPQAPSFTTTFQGDITSKILPGSQPALMYLAPGSNSISFFAASSTVAATLSWQKRYNGTADLVN
jgi:hypothetical protein